MAEKQKTNALLKSITIFLSGLVVMAFGIALAIKVDIGVAPGSVIAYSVSKLLPLSVGVLSSMFHILCLLIQLLLTRRITVKLLLQFPLAYVFGFLLDFFLGFMTFELPGMAMRVILLILALPVFSLGIRAIVGSGFLILPTDGLAQTMGEKLNLPMSKGKLLFDVIVTAIGVVMMLIFTGNAFLTVNVGTVICAIGTGPFIGLFTKLFPFLGVKPT